VGFAHKQEIDGSALSIRYAISPKIPANLGKNQDTARHQPKIRVVFPEIWGCTPMSLPATRNSFTIRAMTGV
jgi:hypothetical protein